MRLAWGITGSGDKINETIKAMMEAKQRNRDLEVEVFLSKAGEQVAKYYRVMDTLKESFDKLYVEKNSNTPFIAARLQLKEFDALIIAPATSNTVAKITAGISDTLLTNGAIQAIKGYVPVYIMPVDYREGEITTILPNGRELRLRVRKEDAENVERLHEMEGIHPFENPAYIHEIIEKIGKDERV